MDHDQLGKLIEQAGLVAYGGKDAEDGPDFCIPVGERMVYIQITSLSTSVFTPVTGPAQSDREALESFLYRLQNAHPGKYITVGDGQAIFAIDLPLEGLTPDALVYTVALCAALGKQCTELLRQFPSGKDGAAKITIDWEASARKEMDNETKHAA